MRRHRLPCPACGKRGCNLTVECLGIQERRGKRLYIYQHTKDLNPAKSYPVQKPEASNREGLE
jgi:hypothetical protein